MNGEGMKDLGCCILTAVLLIALMISLSFLPDAYRSVKDKAYATAAGISLNMEMKKDSLKQLNTQDNNAQEAK